MFRPNPQRRGRVAALAVAALTAAALPSAAQAASFDQVDRESGATSDAPFGPSSAYPVLTGDTGRTAYFTRSSPLSYDPANPFPDTVRRDVVTNRTTALGLGGSTRVVGQDAAERVLLLERFGPNFSTHDFVVRPAAGGPSRPIPGSDLAADAMISGNGRFVVLSGDTIGTRVVTVATGATRQVGPQQIDLNRFSVSDDASVIGGSHESSDGDYTRGGYFDRSGAFTTVDNPAVVSPNGAAVAWVEDAPGGDDDTLVARRLDGSPDTRSPTPGTNSAQLQWIAPDGSRVVYAGVDAGQIYDTKAIAVDTRTGAQTTFGGIYTRYIGGEEIQGFNPPNSVISRSGRYATVQYGAGHLAMVDLTERTLPGGGDPLSASSYFRPGAIRSCPYTGETPPWGGEPEPDRSYVGLALLRPAIFAPRPLGATVSIAFDGKVVKTAVLTKVALDGQAPEAGSSVYLALPQTVKKVTIRSTVLNAQGRVVTGSQTLEPIDLCFKPVAGEE